jgi:hypothetical protein
MFIAYEVSLDLIRELRTLVLVIARHDRELAAQIRNAASSPGSRCDPKHTRDGNTPVYLLPNVSQGWPDADVQTASIDAFVDAVEDGTFEFVFED